MTAPATILDLSRMPAFLVRDRVRAPCYLGWPGLKRHGFSSYEYRGFRIRRNGRQFILERANVCALFEESYPTLKAALDQVDWLLRCAA